MILLLYVDDSFLTGEENLILDSKRKLVAKFEMKDLDMMHYFLGLECDKNWARLFSVKESMLWRF